MFHGKDEDMLKWLRRVFFGEHSRPKKCAPNPEHQRLLREKRQQLTHTYGSSGFEQRADWRKISYFANSMACEICCAFIPQFSYCAVAKQKRNRRGDCMGFESTRVHGVSDPTKDQAPQELERLIEAKNNDLLQLFGAKGVERMRRQSKPIYYTSATLECRTCIAFIPETSTCAFVSETTAPTGWCQSAERR